MSADQILNDSLKEKWGKRKTAGEEEDQEVQTPSAGDTNLMTVQMQDEFLGEEVPDLTLKDTPNGPAPNVYVGKRNFIHQLMDVALLMANVSQLKALLAVKHNDFFHLLLVFISLSICLQIIFTICMLIIWSIEKKLEVDTNTEQPSEHCPHTERKKSLANWLDQAGSILVLFIIVSNVFITGFGVENHWDHIDPSQGSQYVIVSNKSMHV